MSYDRAVHISHHLAGFLAELGLCMQLIESQAVPLQYSGIKNGHQRRNLWVEHRCSVIFSTLGWEMLDGSCSQAGGRRLPLVFDFVATVEKLWLHYIYSFDRVTGRAIKYRGNAHTARTIYMHTAVHFSSPWMHRSARLALITSGRFQWFWAPCNSAQLFTVSRGSLVCILTPSSRFASLILELVPSFQAW